MHHEGNRPPNRKILQSLRLLTFYPPVHDIVPELIALLDSQNLHIARLAHYHLRIAAPYHDPGLYRELVEALERQVISTAPARRAAATKTLARVFQANDVARATDFCVDVFNCIGGARVKVPEPTGRTIAGLELPKKRKPEKKMGLKDRLDPKGILSRKVVSVEAYDAPKEEAREQKRRGVDDGTGGELLSTRGNAEFIRSKLGKIVVGHSVFAGLRRINRVATANARVETYLIDSGLMSVVASTVRHTMALLELRSIVSPGAVAKYLVGRLPHKNPPAHKRLHLQDLGARVYFARLLAALAEDPNLSAFIPDEAPKQANRDRPRANQSLKSAVAAPTVKAKASGLFKFLFNRERVAEVVGAVKSSTSAITNSKVPRLKRDDPLGVEFAEALTNLLKNASNRVLIEALRGLSRRRWTTWFEAPIPQGALYNSPELEEGDAYGGTAEGWGLDEDDEKDEDLEDVDELGAYEDDLEGVDEESKGTGTNKEEEMDPELDELGGSAGSKDGWFARINTKRKERREARIDKSTPFYLRKVGQGMVPALEVILRRLNGALLNDEPVRRFAATDAVIVLARAKMYGHRESDHAKLRKAQSSFASSSASRNSASRALVPIEQTGTVSVYEGSAFNDERHPFQPLVRPLSEIVNEDPNQFVRGRAAIALLFVIACGAGRAVLEQEDSGFDLTEDAVSKSTQLQKTPLLLRYFRSFVTHASAGAGVGLKLMSELVDYLVYEVLDVAPELAPSAVKLTELWAMTHPTVGVCGRLGAIWEKALSIGQGEAVGKSLFRCIDSTPRTERVASAGVIFLRRRTLDLAIITVGSSQITGVALPEPLPSAIGVEMEKYFSLLWHTALLGPSAECRIFAVEALGGAAVLAGEPFRCCAYERLVELVRMRGFGLKIPAEQVLNCLDMLYFSRERFSEARAKNRVARDGSVRSKEWLELVWRLAAEASSAAQILLGVPPPTGWQPLGPAGATDLANAESRFGDVRDRQDNEKLKDASVAAASAPDSIPLLPPQEPRKMGSGGLGDVPPTLSVRQSEPDMNGGNGPSGRYRDDVDSYSSAARNLIPEDRRRSRSRSPGGFHLPRNRSGLDERRRRSDHSWREEADDREYSPGRESSRRRSRSHSPRREGFRRYSREYSPVGEGSRRRTRDYSPQGSRYSEEYAARDISPHAQRRATESSLSQREREQRAQQEKADFELAKRLQEGGRIDGSASGSKDMLEKAGDVAERFLQKGSKLTTKMVNSMKK